MTDGCPPPRKKKEGVEGVGEGGHIRPCSVPFFFPRVKRSCDYCFHDNRHGVDDWYLNLEPVPLHFITCLRFLDKKKHFQTVPF